MRERDLREALAEWFESHEGDPHIWRSPVGALIKGRLQGRGNFKNSPRGKPLRGGSAPRAISTRQGPPRPGVSGAGRKVMPWEKDDEA